MGSAEARIAEDAEFAAADIEQRHGHRIIGVRLAKYDSDAYAQVALRKRRTDGSRGGTVGIAHDNRNGFGAGCAFGPMRKAYGDEVLEPGFLVGSSRHHEKRRRSDAHVRFPI